MNKVGVAGGSWGVACDALDVAHVGLPFPSASEANLHCADLQARLRTGQQTFGILRSDRVDAIVDTDGAGLTFVEGPGGLADLKLTHESLGLPLLSHCHHPVATLFGGLPWGIAWQVLASTSWTKVFTDAAHVKELRHFGVPNVIQLPPSAPDMEYDTAPLATTPPAVDVSFFGDACAARLSLASVAPFGADWIGRAGSAIRIERPEMPFFDIYHSLYLCHTPPSPTDSPDARIQQAGEYFRAKHLYAASLAMARRDRFVIFLARRLGERFRIFGYGWEAYGLRATPPPSAREDDLRQIRGSAINLNLIASDVECGLNARHFEITAAGGFMLCYDQPEVRECFEVGAECDTFTDEEGLLRKVHYYLAHPERRRGIALAGQQRTLREHLQRHRLLSLLATLPPEPPAALIDSKTQGSARADSLGMDRSAYRSPFVGRVVEPPQSLLVLLNPGKFTRHYLTDMADAAVRLGIPTVTYEISEAWEHTHAGRPPDGSAFAKFLRERNVRAVLGQTVNGLLEWPCVKTSDGRTVSLLEQLGVRHLMWWTDHPQWANERVGLRADLQPLLRSPNVHHFVKSTLAARELHEILGWPNVHALPVAENPDRLQPATDIKTEFDVVTVVGSLPSLDPALERFLADDDPDVEAVAKTVARTVAQRLDKLWSDEAPPEVESSLAAFGRAWTQLRQTETLTGSFWLFQRLAPAHPEATAWLRENYRVYIEALHILWEFGRWPRTFYLMYLAKYFRIGVFGADWSSVGLGASDWIDHAEQPRVYARGRLALSIPQAGDEEGISHKPFQIAASRVPMLHINRLGLSDCFTPGLEVATFDTPRQARDTIAALLDDPERRSTMAAAARDRLCREHTWLHRLPQMLSAAGVDFPTAPTASTSPVLEWDPRIHQRAPVSLVPVPV